MVQHAITGQKRSGDPEDVAYTKSRIEEGRVIDAWVRAAREIGARSQRATVAPGPPAENWLDRLRKLAALHASGVLTDEEFSTHKVRLLRRLDED